MKVNIGPHKNERVIEVHIDEYDIWNMDDTLAHIILPMLKQLKEKKHGAPCVDNEDVPKKLHMTKVWKEERYNRNGETDLHFFDRWDYVINEMIYAFQAKINDDIEFFFEDEEPQYKVAKIEFKGVGQCQLRLFPNDNGSMEDYELYEWVTGKQGRFDKEAYLAYQERVSNGFRLFGKYYESLWN